MRWHLPNWALLIDLYDPPAGIPLKPKLASFSRMTWKELLMSSYVIPALTLSLRPNPNWNTIKPWAMLMGLGLRVRTDLSHSFVRDTCSWFRDDWNEGGGALETLHLTSVFNSRLVWNLKNSYMEGSWVLEQQCKSPCRYPVLVSAVLIILELPALLIALSQSHLDNSDSVSTKGNGSHFVHQRKPCTSALLY